MIRVEYRGLEVLVRVRCPTALEPDVFGIHPDAGCADVYPLLEFDANPYRCIARTIRVVLQLLQKSGG